MGLLKKPPRFLGKTAYYYIGMNPRVCVDIVYTRNFGYYPTPHTHSRMAGASPLINAPLLPYGYHTPTVPFGFRLLTFPIIAVGRFADILYQCREGWSVVCIDALIEPYFPFPVSATFNTRYCPFNTPDLGEGMYSVSITSENCF